MKFKALIDKEQWFIIPSFGFISHKRYFGYPVWSIAFAWLCFRCRFQFGAKKVRFDNA